MAPPEEAGPLTAAGGHAATAVSVRVRYFAGARAAAGRAEESVRVNPPGDDPVTVADVLDAVLRVRGERFAAVIPACSFLLDGVAVRDRSAPVADGTELDVLPPFAGG